MSQINFIPAFAGFFKASGYAFGCANGGPQGLSVHNVPIAASTTALTVAFGYSTLLGGDSFYPLATNAPIVVGADSNVETVTPSAVSAALPGYGAMNFSATFANAHAEGDPISSGTFGLQEAINAANAAGGGVVVVDANWASLGGTTAMIAAAVLPTNGSVTILDNRAGGGSLVTTTVTVANAQVLTNNTVPTVLLPAPGAGNMWDIIDMVVENKNLGVAYTGGGVMAAYYGTTSAGVLASATIAATFLTSPTAAHVIKVAGALADTASTAILNAGVVFTNPTANFAAGTGTLIIKVSARLLTGF